MRLRALSSKPPKSSVAQTSEGLIFINFSQQTVFALPCKRFCYSMGIIMKAKVILYTRPGCSLCDEAKAAMRASAGEDEFTLEEVNIDEDSSLRDQYGYDIPVIFINGVKAFKHRIDPREFHRKIRRLSRNA
jgi:glutaredoxin